MTNLLPNEAPWILYEVLGLLGVSCYIIAYALLQARIIHGNGYAFVSLNGLAATGILISLTNSFNLYSAISQVFFITISIFAIAKMYLRNHAVAEVGYALVNKPSFIQRFVGDAQAFGATKEIYEPVFDKQHVENQLQEPDVRDRQYALVLGALG